MSGKELGIDDTLFTLIVIYAGVAIGGMWLAMGLWAYHDMRARSRDGLAQLFMGLMVMALHLLGLLIYLFLRPRETLAEAYERSLEEEALLQEIEEKPSCPGCGQRVQGRWQVCPNCHTRLKKPCIVCRNLLELSWNLCPYCAASQGGQAEVDPIENYTRPPATMPEQRVSLTRKPSDSPTGDIADTLEFVDSDEY